MSEIGFETRLKVSYEDARQKIADALKAEGFGVLTEIDVKNTLKQKLDLDFRRYTILGACNPKLAHKALEAKLDVGLLLPCNVTMYEDGDEVVVTAVDPNAMMMVFKDDALLHEVAAEAEAKLKRAIESL
ncbi:MAG: DUF302 domain-containing protein [Anaerolineales bacterium]|nr:DUF302 domain-containing protein [candidate division KSB1 bacterium]MCB9111352.1 DUF302 domain-containing protein [Anaerolineales bacterium]